MSGANAAPARRRRAGFLWALRFLVGVAFLSAGTGKLFDPTAAAEGFARFGLPAWLVIPIGAAEVLGGVGLWVNRSTRPAAVTLTLVMVGAAGSHLLHDPFSAAIPALVLGALCATIATLGGKR